MAATNPKDKFYRIVTDHALSYFEVSDEFTQAFYRLQNYNPGYGPMIDVDWINPVTGNKITYKASNGQLVFNGNPISVVSGADRREVYLNLTRFMIYCMRAYDDAYGL